ncbi:MAG TPA: NAD-dependent protein deacylase [Longimicrobiales bacterium]|nr:NAD-dependent protein deacylase [Longimicrobiales bacterium]
MEPTLDAQVDRARDLLAGAGRVLVLTGAGISAESGVPTFRGTQGLWRAQRPEDLATPEAFRRDPRLVWEWYAWRRDLVLGCRPNPGHRALHRWLRARKGIAALATQNVDGLHARAASEESEANGPPDDPALPYPLLELHGSLFRVRCTACGREEPHTASVDATSLETLPRCAACGGLLRPAVVWFGEILPEAALSEAWAWAAAAEVALVVGTSALVHPAASLPRATLERGGVVVEVNPQASPLTPASAVSLRGPAGILLAKVLGTGEPTRV